jgi:hypothetical protein
LSFKLVLKFGACLVLTSPFSRMCIAQQPAASDSSAPSQTQSSAPPQNAPQPSSGQSADKRKDESTQKAADTGKVAGTSNDRLFFALPNFLTVPNGQRPPLSSKDKFKVVALGAFDYVQIPWWGTIAALNQANDSEPAFRQGWLSYAKRYGETAGDSVIENFMVGAVFPSVLRQDPRFYYSDKGGFARRWAYAVSRIVVTRSDAGHTQFNYSEVFGAATAAAISTYTYHPHSTYISTPSNPHFFVPSDRTLTNTVSVWGTQMGLDTITLVIKEFWPSVHHKLKHNSAGAQPSASLNQPVEELLIGD